MNSNQQSTQMVTLGGGCFWCLEAVFDNLKGVEDVVSGYCGGKLPKPSYQVVCSGLSGHAEVVQLRFDPVQISFKDILHVFFSIHDPTTRNRQGADIGSQYRSVIFYHTPEQKAESEEVIRELSEEKLWDKPIVTEVKEMPTFYPAEEHHQEYFARNPEQGYCQIVVAPKVAKFRKKFTDRLKS